MSSVEGRARTAATMLSVNFYPFVGALCFGWSLHTVLVLYWVEAGLAFVRYSFEGLFAEHPRADRYHGQLVPLERLEQKRGHVRVSERLPPLYPRNVPFVLQGLFAGGFLWLLAGVWVVSFRPDGALAGDVLGSGVVALSAGLTLFGTIFCYGFATAESFREKRYETVSALSVVSRRDVFGVVVLAFFAPIVGEPTGWRAFGLETTLALFVAARLAFSLAEAGIPVLRRLRQRESDFVGEAETIRVPTDEPVGRVETDTRAITQYAVLFGTLLAVFPPTIVFAIVGGLVGNFLGGPIGGVTGALLVVATRSLVEIPVMRLVSDNVEYRVYDEAIVAYDTKLDEPQWRLPRDEITDVVVFDGPLRGLLPEGFGKMKIKCRDGEYERLPFLSDPDRVSELLERRL